MKKSILLMLVIALICQAFTSQAEEKVPDGKQQQLVQNSQPGNTGEELTVVVGRNRVRFLGNDSLVVTEIEDREIFEEKEDDESLLINESDERKEYSERKESGYSRYTVTYDNQDDDYYRENRARHFRGHWAGFEIGFNNYMHVSETTLPDEIAYMSLDAGNSNCFNLNFSQTNIGFGRRAGLVTGMGLNWNTYRFEGNSTIDVASDGVIAEFIPDGSVEVKKSKFNVLYLNVPLLLEVQIPAGYSSRLNVAAGVIGGLKLYANTKVVYEDGEKIKNNGDFNLNMLRGGVTARVGFENLSIFGTYYLTPWFEDNRGPEGYNLEPFEIGLAFTFNN